MKIDLLKFLSTFIVIALVGCGGGEPENNNNSTSNQNDTTTSGSATLSWTAPTTRSDGSLLPMSEIAGYKIYMGTSVIALNFVADIDDAYIMKHTMNNLTGGTYYFAVSTYDINNIESDISSVVSKSI